MVQIIYNKTKMSNLRIDFSEQRALSLPNLLYISYSKYEKDWSSIMHSHSFTEFMYIDKGEVEILTRHKTFPAKSGDFVVLPPGLYHTEKSGLDENIEYYVLGVSNIVLRDYAGSEAFNPVLALGQYGPKISTGIRKLFNVLNSNTKGHEVEVMAIFLEIVNTLMHLPASPFVIRETSNKKGQMVAVKDFIDTHYMQNISLDDLANTFHLSKFHLAREFSRTFSLSPIAYLEQRRIREARYLLSSTEFSMTDISTTLGFSSSSYFSQRFKVAMGMSPLEFRKSSK